MPFVDPRHTFYCYEGVSTGADRLAGSAFTEFSAIGLLAACLNNSLVFSAFPHALTFRAGLTDFFTVIGSGAFSGDSVLDDSDI